MQPTTMTLQSFIAKQLEELRAFEAHWNEQHTKDPDNFPLWLNKPSEWLEQFDAYQNR